MDKPILSFSEFEKLDPRRQSGNFTYPFNELIFLTISGVVSGAEGWEDIIIFGKNQLDWLRKYFPYESEIPSPDTLERLFAAIEPKKFSEAFILWVQNVTNLKTEGLVAIDGKTMRGSGTSARSAVHIISAYSTANQLTLGQLSTEAKSNEITKIPELLDLLDLKGATVSLDAMGCQREIAAKIREKEADYILAVKDNQSELKQQIEKLFTLSEVADSEINTDFVGGRTEKRTCQIISDLTFLDGKEKWADLNCVFRIERSREFKKSGKKTEQISYYISSREPNAELLNNCVRAHWNIENCLHWQLDVSFGEDRSRKNKGNSAINFASINRISLNLISLEKTSKKSKKVKRLQSAWNPEYRELVLKI